MLGCCQPLEQYSGQKLQRKLKSSIINNAVQLLEQNDADPKNDFYGQL